MEDEQMVTTASEGSKKPSKLLTVLAVVFLVLVGGYLFMNRGKSKVQKPQNTQNQVQQVSEKPANQVIVSDYSAGDTVTVAVALLASPGFAVVHEDAQGEPGDVIGVSEPLQAGELSDVLVALDNPVVEGDSVHVVLHGDNGDLTFIEKDDQPLTDDEGSLVVSSYLVGAGE